MNKEDTPAMQHHCVHCGREQYRPAVYAVSLGDHPCVWCGLKSKRMSLSDYEKAMEKFRTPKQKR